MLRSLGTVLLQQLDNGRAHDHSVGQLGHLPGLLRSGDAKADGTGNLGVLPHCVHDRAQVGGDLAAGAGDPQAGHQIEEALRLPGNSGNAVLRCGGDEGNKVQAVGAAGCGKLLLLLVGDVGQDDAVHPNFCCPGQEAVGTVGEDHVGVGHEHQRDGYVLSQLLHQSKNLVRGDVPLQGPQISSLDDGTLGGGVGEGYAQLDKVSPVGGSGTDGGSGGLQVGVAAGEKGNKCLAVVKGSFDLTHGYPLLCNGQWRRSPCRHGPRS